MTASEYCMRELQKLMNSSNFIWHPQDIGFFSCPTEACGPQDEKLSHTKSSSESSLSCEGICSHSGTRMSFSSDNCLCVCVFILICYSFLCISLFFMWTSFVHSKLLFPRVGHIQPRAPCQAFSFSHKINVGSPSGLMWAAIIGSLRKV